MGKVRAAIFDIGNVLFTWHPRFLYERLIGDDQALAAFLDEVVTIEWHFQHDEGRDFADTSAELTALYPQHADLIAAWKTRFNESIGGPVPGMHDLVADLDSAEVPLFAITNFSHEFFPPFRAEWTGLFDRFRDIVVSGDEKLVKPDPAIYHLSLARFGLEPHETVFIDDNEANILSARALGIRSVHFKDAESTRREIVEAGLLAA